MPGGLDPYGRPTASSAGGFVLEIVNAHVGNAGPLAVAIDELRFAGHLRAGIVHWFELTDEIAGRVTADAQDWHAHAAETSLMLHLRPDLVMADQLIDEPDRTGELVLSYSVAETSESGATGSPSQGSTAQGEELLELAADALSRRIEAARTEQPPIASVRSSSG